MDIEQRFKRHKSSLRANSHINKHLQSTWNKYGEKYFRLEIVEIIKNPTVIKLFKKEQYWLDHYKCYDNTIGFNKCDKATLGKSKCFNRAKTYLIISPDKKEFIITNLEEFCRKYDLATTGLHNVANGSAWQYKGWYCRHIHDTNKDWLKRRKRGKKSGNGWKGDWLIEKTNGEKITVNSLLKFCKDNGYSQGTLYLFMAGKRKSYKDIRHVKKIKQ